MLLKTLAGAAAVNALLLLPAAAQDIPSIAILEALTPTEAAPSVPADVTEPTRQIGVQATTTAAAKTAVCGDVRLIDAVLAGEVDIGQRVIRDDLKNLIAACAMPQLDLAINFDSGSADINSRAARALDQLGAALVELGEGRFMLGGHTDSRGSPESNQKLSEARAFSVRSYLSQRFGIDPERLVAVGYGEEDLRYADDADNRRVTVINLVIR